MKLVYTNENRLMVLNIRNILSDHGIEVIINLCERLIKYGVPGIHFYTVNREEPTSIIIKNLDI